MSMAELVASTSTSRGLDVATDRGAEFFREFNPLGATGNTNECTPSWGSMTNGRNSADLFMIAILSRCVTIQK